MEDPIIMVDPDDQS